MARDDQRMESAIMKPKIHPKYDEATVTCACGNEFTTRATMTEIHLDICSVCHPFYTGKQKFVDTAGRVEKFQKRFAWKDASSTEVLEKQEANRDTERKRLEEEAEAAREDAKNRKKANQDRRKQILEQKRVQAEKAAAAAAAAEKAAAEAPAAPPAEEPKAEEKPAPAPEPKSNEPSPVPIKTHKGGPVAARAPKKEEDGDS